MKRRALFLDRDGTVCEEAGTMDRLDKLRLLEGSAQAIRRASDAGFLIVVVTNQSGVARGLIDEALVHQAHEKLRALLAPRGARVDAVYYCPHHPEGAVEAYRRDCSCRKPQPGLLFRARDELGVDLPSSFLVGDSARDVEAGHRAGAGTVLVLTGHGREEMETRSAGWSIWPDYVAADLSSAVDWILARRS